MMYLVVHNKFTLVSVLGVLVLLVDVLVKGRA